MGRKGDGVVDLAASKERLFRRLREQFGNTRGLQAAERVPREAFIPVESRALAYEDTPLPIGYGQTISQPYIVVMMTAALELKPADKVLEVGAGSGYQAAILAELAWRVITVERIPELAHSARAVLDSLGYGHRIDVRLAGDVLGCPEEAPFDAILVTAGAPRLPRTLLDQLAPEGRLVVPVGSRFEQDLVHVVRKGAAFTIRSLGPCRFVPLVGNGAWESPLRAWDASVVLKRRWPAAPVLYSKLLSVAPAGHNQDTHDKAEATHQTPPLRGRPLPRRAPGASGPRRGAQNQARWRSIARQDGGPHL
jgi:protein-L-isoaspartate(D-aspartate) O-methyltransferase